MQLKATSTSTYWQDFRPILFCVNVLSDITGLYLGITSPEFI